MLRKPKLFDVFELKNNVCPFFSPKLTWFLINLLLYHMVRRENKNTVKWLEKQGSKQK